MLVFVPSVIALLLASTLQDVELRKSLYTGAVTLVFAGLLGGMLKILLDDVVATKRKREDDATFVTNVLADLKSVYDRVARARILIPAHKSVKTYGDEMRDLIEAQVQLRNVTRALERRTQGIKARAREGNYSARASDGDVLARLKEEFGENYKPLSDRQRGFLPTSLVTAKHILLSLKRR